MKKIIPLIAAFVVIKFIAVAKADDKFSLTSVNTKIDQLIAGKLHITNSSLDDQARQENRVFKELIGLTKDSWQEILEDFDNLSGGKDGKKLLFESMHFLTPVEYMSVFDWMVDKFEAGQFEKADITGFMDSSGPMIHFFSDNYQHVRVNTALNKLKSKVMNDADLTQAINDILDGSNKQSLDELREDHEYEWEANWPKYILPE